jgi:outer membrane receptor protein involved in Fe transport
VAAVGALVAAPAPGQEVGSILGTVRDFQTGRPVMGGQVSVEGTRTSATSDGVGRYWLLNLAPGTVRLRISAPGYVTMVQELRVRGDEQSVAHFHLQSAAVLLERLVVIGKAVDVADRSVRMTPAEDPSPVTLVELLDRAAPGIVVSRGSGQVGAGTRVQLRGAKSLTAPTPPLIFIDGVRVEYAATAVGAGPAGVSVLDLLDPARIETIEVLRGPEAARYGLGAQNGVILITMRQGTRPRP